MLISYTTGRDATIALPDDLDATRYLDASIDVATTPAHHYFGEVAALTSAGVYVHVGYKGDEVGELTIRPLRGDVASIEVSDDEPSVERGRIPAGGVTITSRGQATVTLPLTMRADGANFLAQILAALA